VFSCKYGIIVNFTNYFYYNGIKTVIWVFFLKNKFFLYFFFFILDIFIILYLTYLSQFFSLFLCIFFKFFSLQFFWKKVLFIIFYTLNIYHSILELFIPYFLFLIFFFFIFLNKNVVIAILF
jgi:hypothetical protein